MGASKEKKVRAELRSEGPDKKSAAAAEKEKSDKKFRRTAIITVVVIVVLAAFAIVYNSNLFYTGTTAVEVDGTDYNAAEVSCFKRIAFENIYSNLSNQYGNYVSIFLARRAAVQRGSDLGGLSLRCDAGLYEADHRAL